MRICGSSSYFSSIDKHENSLFKQKKNLFLKKTEKIFVRRLTGSK